MKKFLVFLIGIVVSFYSCNLSKDETVIIPFEKINVDNIDLTDDLWDGHAICYGGYREGQSPATGIFPSDDQILEDLRILERKWNIIRFYNSNTEGESILRLIEENQIDLKVVMGIYLSGDSASSQTNIEEALRLAETYPDNIIGINIGNEIRVSWSFVPVSQEDTISYINQVKTGLSEAGLSIPITVADNYEFWESSEGAEVAALIDFVFVHAYALWDGYGLEDSITFVEEHINTIKSNIPDTPIVIGETGWATHARDSQIYATLGPIANEENQVEYFFNITEWAEENNITTFLFEAFDEPWKGSEYGAETHWGLFDVNRKCKTVMENYFPELITESPTSPNYDGFVFEASANINIAFEYPFSTLFSGIATSLTPDNDGTIVSVLENDEISMSGLTSLEISHNGVGKGGFYAELEEPTDISAYDEIVFNMYTSSIPADLTWLRFSLTTSDGGVSSINVMNYIGASEDNWTSLTIPLSDMYAEFWGPRAADFQTYNITHIQIFNPYNNPLGPLDYSSIDYENIDYDNLPWNDGDYLECNLIIDGIYLQ